jgi:tetratricopeptide (TPR) repeat protein
MAKLILSLNEIIQGEYALNKERILIGRKPDSDIWIDNLAVSSKHALIVTILDDSFLEDLGSTNGTYVNGKLIKKHALKNGDVIGLGKHELKYVNEHATADHPFYRKPTTEARDAGLKLKRLAPLSPRQWKALQSALAFDRDKRTPTVDCFLKDFNAKQWQPLPLALGITASVVLVAGTLAVYIGSVDFSIVGDRGPEAMVTATRTSSDQHELPKAQTDYRQAKAELSDNLAAQLPALGEGSTAQSELHMEPQGTPRGDLIVAYPQMSGQAQQESPEPAMDKELVSAPSSPPSDRSVQPAPAQVAANPNAKVEHAALETGRDTAVAIDTTSDQSASLTQQTSGEVQAQPPDGTIKPSDQADQGQAMPEKAGEKVETRVVELLARAERQVMAQHFTSPMGDAALQTYQEILQLVPEHEGAQKGLEKIKVWYQKSAAAAKQKKDWKGARAFLEKSQTVDPKDLSLAGALRQLEEEKTAEEEAIRKAEAEQLQLAKAATPVVQPPPENLGVALEIARVDHEVRTDSDPATVSIRANVTGPVARTEVFLETDQGFTPHAMYDDGAHRDLAIGDGMFGAKLKLSNPPSHGGTRYYVAAHTKEGMVAYSPANATKETHLIKPLASKLPPLAVLKPPPVSEPRPPVVINEFMASNSQTISDSQGGYDDWIELHNLSAETVDLSGYYLSDDSKKPKKWRFPNGTKIGAHSYLLIWADKGYYYTEGAAGVLHTNFDLSRFGGEILLIDKDENGNAVLDRVSFGRQREDISMGRSPDGSFTTQHAPTPDRGK